VAWFAVVRARGEGWDASVPMREQAGWDEHAAFMDGLAGEGVVVLGGPVGEGERQFLLIFEAASAEEVEERLAADPWAPTRQLRIASIEPWTVLLRSIA
jgi:uncharacterized protein YciI